MKNTVMYILLFLVLSAFTFSCESDKDNSLYYPDFAWNKENDDENGDDENKDPETETSMRVATYNFKVESGDGWNSRRKQVAQLITDYNFEICGFEEASWSQRSYLGAQLGDKYNFLAYGRDTGNDDSQSGEMSGILYKKERFTLLEAGRFWYSETPDVPSYGWDETGYKRFCVWGKFKDVKTQKEFYLFESHMPLYGVARAKACKMLVDAVNDIKKENTAAFCTGDFNNIPEADEIANTICKSGILKDSYLETTELKGPSYTFPSKKTRIDFIFVKDVKVLSSRIIESPLSDHYPLVIVAEI